MGDRFRSESRSGFRPSSQIPKVIRSKSAMNPLPSIHLSRPATSKGDYVMMGRGKLQSPVDNYTYDEDDAKVQGETEYVYGTDPHVETHIVHQPAQVDYEMIQLRNDINILISKNSKLNLIHPDTYGINEVNALKDYYQRYLLRPVEVSKNKRKCIRWYVFATAFSEAWLTKIIGINALGFIEDQIDMINEDDTLMYNIADEITPKENGKKTSPMKQLAWNFFGGLALVSGINLVTYFARSYAPYASDQLINTGGNLVKKLLRNNDEIENDPLLNKVIGLYNFIKEVDPSTISKVTSQFIPQQGGAQSMPSASNVSYNL